LPGGTGYPQSSTKVSAITNHPWRPPPPGFPGALTSPAGRIAYTDPTGAELEQVVAAGLYKAFAERRDLAENDIANAIEETVPLYETYEERIKELRDWARTRARPATLDAKMVDLFGSRS
jgi:hypothetical protein